MAAQTSYGAMTALDGTELLTGVQGGVTKNATPDQIRTVVKAVDATSTDGVILETSTAATVGAQKYSPRVRWKGKGWKTTATAASQDVEFIAEVQPVQGAANPTGNLVFSSAINGGAFTSRATLDTAGLLTVSRVIASGNGTASAPSVLVGLSAGLYSRDGYTTNISNGGGAGVVEVGGSGVGIANGFVLGWATPAGKNDVCNTAFSRISDGVAGLGTGAQGSFAGDLKLRGLWFGSSLTVGTLPSAASSDGLIYRVSDLTAPTLGATASGGGAAKGLVQSNATNWQVLHFG